mmetsp:Transcript_12212/g.14189  ORF Transcript_12212/g.14189 Transcript_12212/m.14189 type:complete len:364 (-) Transcript_12212:469-1560(-)
MSSLVPSGQRSFEKCSIVAFAAAGGIAGLAFSFRWNFLRKESFPKLYSKLKLILPRIVAKIEVSASGHKLLGSSSLLKTGSEEYLEEVLLQEDVTHLHVLMDFDHTLTSHCSKQCHDTLVNDEHLPGEFFEEITRMLDFSTPNPILEGKPAQYWWEHINNMFVSHKISEEQIRQTVLHTRTTIRLREGAKELLQELNRLHIPLTIVSAGFSHIIEDILECEEVLFDNIRILSNELKFENGVVVGTHPNPPVHSYNKHLTYEMLQEWFDGESHHAITSAGHSQDTIHRRLLVVGDSIGDTKIAENIPNATQLKVGFFKENIWHKREEFEEVYDVILPIHESLHWLTNELRREKFTKRSSPPKEL